MTFFKRLSYYLFGFTIGLFFLLFIFGGKKTQCNYSPSSRVKNDILEKDWVFQNNIDISQPIGVVSLVTKRYDINIKIIPQTF